MTHTRLIGVGAFVIGGILLFAVGLFMIGNRRMLFVDRFQVDAEFAKVTGLQKGAIVRVSGMDAGEIESDPRARESGVALPRADARAGRPASSRAQRFGRDDSDRRPGRQQLHPDRDRDGQGADRAGGLVDSEPRAVRLRGADGAGERDRQDARRDDRAAARRRRGGARRDHRYGAAGQRDHRRRGRRCEVDHVERAQDREGHPGGDGGGQRRARHDGEARQG